MNQSNELSYFLKMWDIGDKILKAPQEPLYNKPFEEIAKILGIDEHDMKLHTDFMAIGKWVRVVSDQKSYDNLNKEEQELYLRFLMSKSIWDGRLPERFYIPINLYITNQDNLIKGMIKFKTGYCNTSCDNRAPVQYLYMNTSPSWHRYPNPHDYIYMECDFFIDPIFAWTTHTRGGFMEIFKITINEPGNHLIAKVLDDTELQKFNKKIIKSVIINTPNNKDIVTKIFSPDNGYYDVKIKEVL